jgi:membrane protein YdbS with pleckstrin-like domain
LYENEFRDILDNNERVIWSDKPHLLVHLATGFPLFIIGIIWGIMDSFLVGNFMMFEGGPFNFFSIFMLLHMMPLWVGIGNMIRLIFIYRNTFFCYTDKRVIIKTGFMGVDYKTKDFYNIENVEVNVGPLENMFGVGTIRIDEEYVRTGKHSRRVGHRLYGIQRPYEVFKALKETVMDIKSDINYPNNYRPETNKGYNTKYDK